MALVKCKECGEDVSTKAKTCPKCGAKAPRKTSKFTWFVLICMIIGIYVAIQTPSYEVSSSTTSQADTVNVSTQVNKKEVPKTAWRTSTSKDEMTGNMSAYANSKSVPPTKAMGFPYHDTKAWLGVGCDGKDEWAYVGFNNAPNLTDTETEDGYNVIQTRIKWDGNIENVRLTQKWGASFIHFSNDSAVISKIMNSNSVLLELQWHGEPSTYFEFPLRGSSAAIKNIRSQFDS